VNGRKVQELDPGAEMSRPLLISLRKVHQPLKKVDGFLVIWILHHSPSFINYRGQHFSCDLLSAPDSHEKQCYETTDQPRLKNAGDYGLKISEKNLSTIEALTTSKAYSTA